MRRQDPGLNKALATTHAHVGLLASVGAGMSCQVAGLDKPLATGHTHTQGFSFVWVAGMPRQVAGLGKALATGRTHEQHFFAPVVVVKTLAQGEFWLHCVHTCCPFCFFSGREGMLVFGGDSWTASFDKLLTTRART